MPNPTTKPPRQGRRSEERTILLTGFEPFGGEAINPSGEIARELHGFVIAGHRVEGALLPCVYGAAVKELRHQIRTVKPALVVCLGQAGGRPDITPERVAINVDDARIADNAGQQPVDRPIAKSGPAAYWSTLPIKAIVVALQRADLPASVSQTAGTFVCNHVFYGLMHALRAQRKIRGGFIHVPFLPGQAKAGQPSLTLERMTTAIRLALETAVQVRRDVRTAGGATH
jgi:pyroglutamyl-peptidase